MMLVYITDMIFVKTFTRPEFLGQNFYIKMRKSEYLQIYDKQRVNASKYQKLHSMCTSLDNMCKVYTICVNLKIYVADKNFT